MTASIRASLLLAALLACAGCTIVPPPPPVDDATQAMARRELDAIHAALLEAHPGAIDDRNPGYRTRIESGYAAAVARLHEVRDVRDAMALSDWYVAGFRDGHLRHGNNALTGDMTIVSGWALARAPDGRPRVTSLVPNWPVPLPPAGAELMFCDGRSPDRLVAEDVLPYFGVLSSYEQELLGIPSLPNPRMSSLHYASCSFRLPDGHERAFVQRYRSVGKDVERAVFRARDDAPGPAPRINDFQLLPDGTLWIRAGDFQPDAGGMARLDTMLAALTKLPAPRRIVFDARGNGGGSSIIGYRIFEAATGGLVFDQDGLDRLPRTQAFWRVSSLGVAALDGRLDQLRHRLGADDALVHGQEQFLLRMHAALARGDRWLLQDDGEPMLAPDELARRHAHLARFAGLVALVTDGDCASACLDFIDLVRSLPGALHVGETTGFDSVYLEVAAIPLPSGNGMILPLKVWRNRVRANDQPWVPQVPLKVSGVDDLQVRAAVLAAIDRAGY